MSVQHRVGVLPGASAETSVVPFVAEHECSVCGRSFRFCVLNSRLSIPREGNTPRGQGFEGENLGLANRPVTLAVVDKL